MNTIGHWMYLHNCNGKAVKKNSSEEDAVIQWHTQAGNITTSLKVILDFTLPTLSANNIVMWKFHADEYSKDRSDMTLGRELLTELRLNVKLSDHTIK